MPANSRTVSAVTLGCKVNQYDTNAMLQSLSEAGFRIVDWSEPSDVRLINTCTVTSIADKKSRAAVRSAVRSGSLVCISGCLAEKEAQLLRGMPGVDAVVTMEERSRIAQIIGGLFPEPVHTGRRPLHIVTGGGRTRGFLKVQEGCSNFCTYCIIPSVRGMPRSRQLAEILADARRLAENGVKEVVVTGIHLCSYGIDTGNALVDLLEELQDIPGLCRVQLGSLEPLYLSEHSIARLAKLPKLVPHFHVSLQSGSGKTLRAMGRRYSPDQFADAVGLLRGAFDNPALSTDVITGFPGETDADFDQSLDFVRRMSFSRLHVFPYSEREGTPAARMKNSVPIHVRRERARTMIDAGLQSAERYAACFEGTVQPVLFDRQETDGASGYTDRYIRVHAQGAKPGEIRYVTLSDRRGAEFHGKITRKPLTDTLRTGNRRPD